LVDRGFDLRSPEEIRLVRGTCSIVGDRNVVVRAANLVLGAVAALGEVLIAADMSTFACITPFAGFGVAPPRRATSGTSHCERVELELNERKRDRDTGGL